MWAIRINSWVAWKRQYTCTIPKSITYDLTYLNVFSVIYCRHKTYVAKLIILEISAICFRVHTSCTTQRVACLGNTVNSWKAENWGYSSSWLPVSSTRSIENSYIIIAIVISHHHCRCHCCRAAVIDVKSTNFNCFLAAMEPTQRLNARLTTIDANRPSVWTSCQWASPISTPLTRFFTKCIKWKHNTEVMPVCSQVLSLKPFDRLR
jgi:hypothetical protein